MLEALQNAKTKPKAKYFLIVLVNIEAPCESALNGNIQQARKILATPPHKNIIVNPDLCIGTDTNNPNPLPNNHKQRANCTCADTLQLDADKRAN